MTTHAIVHAVAVAAHAPSRSTSTSQCVLLREDGTWLVIAGSDCGPVPSTPALPPIAPPPPPPRLADPEPRPLPTGRHPVRLRSRRR